MGFSSLSFQTPMPRRSPDSEHSDLQLRLLCHHPSISPLTTRITTRIILMAYSSPFLCRADRSSTSHSPPWILGPVSVSFPVRLVKFWCSILSKVYTHGLVPSLVV